MINMETLSTTSQGDSVKSDDSSPQHDSGRGSPPPKCAICLGTCKNKSFTDSCLHQFCFKCILQWSKVKAECPLCKQNFKSIIHNVRSNDQYEEYMVEQRTQEQERIEIENIRNATRRYRYSRDSWAFRQLLINYGARRAPVASRRQQPSYFRRTVYRHNLWARPLPDFTGRFRDCTPEFYRANDSQMHRLVPWCTRELHYLLNENIGHMSFVMDRIMDLLPRYHINSSEFRDALQRYFGGRTEHFLHELYCFASTPYDLAGYDRNIQYTTDTRVSTMVNEVLSSSDPESMDSDMTIEEFLRYLPNSSPPGPSRAPPPVYPQTNISNPPINNVIPIETISHSDTDDGDEVMVVGYIKPPHARTPEVVDLLESDSDVVIEDDPQPTTSAQQQPQTSQVQESRPASLVKITITQRRTLPAAAPPAAAPSAAAPPAAATSTAAPPAAAPPHTSDSDSSSYTPPLPRRKRPQRPTKGPDESSPETSNPSKSDYHTPSSSTVSFNSDSSSDSFNPRDRRVKRKKTKRKNSYSERSKKKTKRSKSNSKSKKTKSKITEVKQTNRKSNSGKGVKSSKRSAIISTSTSSERTQAALDQPSTSGTQSSSKSDKKKRVENKSSTAESKRLRSAITIVTNQRNLRSVTCIVTSSQASSSKSNTVEDEAQSRGEASTSDRVNNSNIVESSDTD